MCRSFIVIAASILILYIIDDVRCCRTIAPYQGDKLTGQISVTGIRG